MSQPQKVFWHYHGGSQNKMKTFYFSLRHRPHLNCKGSDLQTIHLDGWKQPLLSKRRAQEAKLAGVCLWGGDRLDLILLCLSDCVLLTEQPWPQHTRRSSRLCEVQGDCLGCHSTRAVFAFFDCTYIALLPHRRLRELAPGAPASLALVRNSSCNLVTEK